MWRVLKRSLLLSTDESCSKWCRKYQVEYGWTRLDFGPSESDLRVGSWSRLRFLGPLPITEERKRRRVVAGREWNETRGTRSTWPLCLHVRRCHRALVFTYIESLPTYNYRLPILPTDILQMSSLDAKFRIAVPDASRISAWGVSLTRLMLRRTW